MSGFFNPTVAWITLRATLSRKRALLFALPAVILILFTLALRASRPPVRPWPSHVLGTFGFSVLLPLTALIIGTSVLGAEIDDGSIVHLLATPVRRSSVVVTKFVIATGLTMVFAAVPELIAALIAGGGSAPAPAGTAPGGTAPGGTGPGGAGLGGLVTVSSGKLALGLFVGALACSVIYNAVFVMVSVATTRAIAVGLLYVLVWETLLSNFVSGVKLLSVSHYGLGIANGFVNDSALAAGLTVTTSVVMGVIVTGIALALAVNLLSSFTLKGEPA
jgi:ABC-2 type transport system permease protein